MNEISIAFSLNAMQLATLDDLPDDLLRVILKMYSDTDRDFNHFRLVCKRLMRVVESCATRLTYQSYNGPDSFPIALRRCMRIERIECYSRKLRSLEGCPTGLICLDIGYGGSIQSLEPLRGCTEPEIFIQWDARSISDLSPLASCTKIKQLRINQYCGKDLSPLSSMPLLEDLNLFNCPSVKSLVPLSGLTNLRVLNCYQYQPGPLSLLSLTSCIGLNQIKCHPLSLEIEDLRKMMPKVRFC